MSTYLAISLGPIYTTIQQARKTRELWATSYLFSRLMEILYGKLETELKKANGQILAPKPLAEKIDNLFGAGIYPDRLFARKGDFDETLLQGLIDDAIDQLAGECIYRFESESKEIKEAFSNFSKVKHLEDAKIFWKKYFRVATLLIDLPEGENVLIKLNDYLDTAEIQPVFTPHEAGLSYLLALLDNPYKTKLVEKLKIEVSMKMSWMKKASFRVLLKLLPWNYFNSIVR